MLECEEVAQELAGKVPEDTASAPGVGRQDEVVGAVAALPVGRILQRREKEGKGTGRGLWASNR